MSWGFFPGKRHHARCVPVPLSRSSDGGQHALSLCFSAGANAAVLFPDRQPDLPGDAPPGRGPERVSRLRHPRVCPLSRRAGHPAHSGRSDSPRPADAEVAALRRAIAVVRGRLGRLESGQLPSVLPEVRSLEAELAALIEDVGVRPGRHRSAVPPVRPDRAESGQVDEAATPACTLDPAAIRTPAELITALRQLKAACPDASWRKMAARAGQRVVHSTMYAAMKGTALPKLEVVQAVVIGCGGSEADVVAFTAAWQRVNSASVDSQPGGPNLLAAPIAAL